MFDFGQRITNKKVANGWGRLRMGLSLIARVLWRPRPSEVGNTRMTSICVLGGEIFRIGMYESLHYVQICM
jgi:hypothetical protein